VCGEHELEWRWANGNNDIRLAVAILAGIPVGKLLVDRRIRKKSCIEVLAIYLDRVRRISQFIRDRLIDHRNGGIVAPNLVQDKDAANGVGLSLDAA